MEKINKDYGAVLMQDGKIIGYETGETDQGFVFKDIDAFINGTGVCYISESEFKEFMDSYEAYMNEYVEFMKKYQKNSTDLTLIAQYAETVKKYTEWADKFDKYDEEHDLTKEELAYYLDVQNRVNKKLLEVSN